MSADPHLLTYYEIHYWANAFYPTRDDVCSQFDFSLDEYKEQLAELIKPLENRGLPVDSIKDYLNPPVKKVKRPENLLDPKFVLAVNQIVDTADKRVLAAKLKALGMTTGQWKAFLRVPENRKYFEDRLNNSFNGDLEFSAKLSLARNVESGDLQSIKYFNEMTGKYRPDAGLGMNIGILLGRFMEILSSRLSPDQLAEIADEFETAIIDTSMRELSS